MKKNVIAASQGIAIGLLISLLMSFIFGQGTYLPLNPFSTMGRYYIQHFDAVTIMLISVSIWAVIGLLFQLADKIFQQDWSLLKMTLVHFLLTTVGFTSLAILAGWFPIKLPSLLFFFVIFLVVYIGIFILNYHSMRVNVEQINRDLGEK